jgi:hypothetical protein
VKTPTEKTLLEFSIPLSREQAEAIYDKGREAVIFVLLSMAAKLSEQQAKDESMEAPSTPSGMVPPYKKPKKGKKGKKPGAKPGHKGARRPTPKITRRVDHLHLDQCPGCGSPLAEPSERRFRLIEDIVESETEVVEHRIPRQWCSQCNKLIEPRVPDALPSASVGHRTVALTAWLHYGLGVSISQVLAVLNHHLHFTLSKGGLVDAWLRLADILHSWYEQIGEQVKSSGVLHADETGWRVSGRTVWLWCFTTSKATYYMIHQSRGSPALARFFTEAFEGVLVTDFWGAYNAVSCAARQACLPHLLREVVKVDGSNGSSDWMAFAKKLRRLVRDAIRLRGKLNEFSDATYASRKTRIEKRLDSLLETPPKDPDVKRLIKRLRRYRNALFTFLDHPDLPSDNNHAEREIRPAVIMRKNSYCNRSANGANTQAILMSVYRTLKLRGLDPLETIVTALKSYVATGSMPSLPN